MRLRLGEPAAVAQNIAFYAAYAAVGQNLAPTAEGLVRAGEVREKFANERVAAAYYVMCKK